MKKYYVSIETARKNRLINTDYKQIDEFIVNANNDFTTAENIIIKHFNNLNEPGNTIMDIRVIDLSLFEKLTIQ